MRKCEISALLLAVAISFPNILTAQDLEPVTVHTAVRAESDIALKKVVDLVGFNTFVHRREPIKIDNQEVIRMNRDTIYSACALDLSKPVFVTMPEAESRYQSLEVVSQDHYVYAMTGAGRYEVNKEKVGTDYAYLIVRIFVDPNNAQDIANANSLQDNIKVEGGGSGPLNIPHWNLENMMDIRNAINTLGKMGASASAGLGLKNEVNPIDHLVVSITGWGGMPEKYAYYIIAQSENTDGTPHTTTVQDVPVDAFWSITVYNDDGFMEKNDKDMYSINSVTAQANENGSYTVNFGGCEDGRVNCIPITKGWNYAIRMYEPRQAILDGTWKFPAINPVK